MTMRTTASRTNAAFSGVLLGLGMPALESWQSTMYTSVEIANWQFLVAVFLLFFAPVLLCVVGVGYFRFGFMDILQRSYWVAFKDVALRALCWFAGAGLAFGLLSVVQTLRA